MWHLGSQTTYRQFTTRRGDDRNKSRSTTKEAIAPNRINYDNNDNDNNNDNNDNNDYNDADINNDNDD